MFRIGPAGAVAEIAVRHANTAAGFVQQFSKLLFAAGNRLGQHNTGIIARLHNHATDQILDPHLLADIHEHLGPAHAPGALTHGQHLIHLQPALLQAIKHDIHGHELGHAGRRHAVIGVLLKQRGAGFEIHDQRLARQHIHIANRGRDRRAFRARRGAARWLRGCRRWALLREGLIRSKP